MLLADSAQVADGKLYILQARPETVKSQAKLAGQTAVFDDIR